MQNRQIPIAKYNKFMQKLKASEPLSKKELTSLKCAINKKASHLQMTALLAAAEFCGCTVEGGQKLAGFQIVKRVWTDEWEPILESVS